MQNKKPTGSKLIWPIQNIQRWFCVAAFEARDMQTRSRRGAYLPSVPRLANSHADAQLLVCEVSKDLHPDFTLDRVSSAILQRQPVRGWTYRRGPNDMPLHLDALWWGLRRCGPVSWSAPVEAQRSDRTRIEVAQLPGGTVHLFGLEVSPLIAEFEGFTEKPFGFLVLHLGLHFDRLAVLSVEAVVWLLDVLIQHFAQLSA